LFSAAESQQAIFFIRAHGYGLVSKVFAPSDLFAVSAELSKQDFKRSRAFRATFFDKSPNSNWLVAWHQTPHCRS
jgi:hypothetical protein